MYYRFIFTVATAVLTLNMFSKRATWKMEVYKAFNPAH